MFYLEKGNIIPGEGIGAIKLGMSNLELESISKDFVVKELPDYLKYKGGDVEIWVSKYQKTITQILVYGDFKGKFLNRFGIGSFLSEIEQHLGYLAEYELYVYIFKSIKGICFELEDIDETGMILTGLRNMHQLNTYQSISNVN